jgi:hypothetical protein
MLPYIDRVIRASRPAKHPKKLGEQALTAKAAEQTTSPDRRGDRQYLMHLQPKPAKQARTKRQASLQQKRIANCKLPEDRITT